ncbi:MAG: DUF4260 domain-containing protein [Flavobacteriales bacterium]|nr:DUF4260 domain-containing protein [Flavobacteriales bacterium]
MNTLLKIEEAAQLALAFVLFLFTGDTWWYFFAWLMAPDISILGYLLGRKWGAWIYNFAHHKAVGIVLFVLGLYFNYDFLLATGLIIVGHSAMDRLFGYGLKYSDSFGHTHLDWIGKHKPQS